MIVDPDIPVTVVVPVKNEGKNIQRCLDRLKRFREVIVVDSSSTDGTKEIVYSSTAQYLNFVWDGFYPKKRNWVLMNHQINSEWVLFIDADEFVSHEFCEEILLAITDQSISGYWLNYTNYFLGRRLKFGVPQRKLALFRVGSALYEKIEEKTWSKLDMEIHEHPMVDGKVGEIKSPIEHNDFRGISKFIERHRDYALWEAQRFYELKNASNSARRKLSSRQKSKYKHLDKWWFPWAFTFYQYFIRMGFLDGRTGFSFALYKFWYLFTIKILIDENSGRLGAAVKKKA